MDAVYSYERTGKLTTTVQHDRARFRPMTTTSTTTLMMMMMLLRTLSHTARVLPHSELRVPRVHCVQPQLVGALDPHITSALPHTLTHVTDTPSQLIGALNLNTSPYLYRPTDGQSECQRK
uniref:Uncharacterized protein n=1 Tax=Anopheles culicifacies TaxID=139723 RepID=A0A182M5S8_9DIPT